MITVTDVKFQYEKNLSFQLHCSASHGYVIDQSVLREIYDDHRTKKKNFWHAGTGYTYIVRCVDRVYQVHLNFFLNGEFY